TSSASRLSLALFLLDFFLDSARRRKGLPDQDGNERAENEYFLERAVPERRVALQQPDEDRARGGGRIADQAADDRADEGFQADQKAGIIIESRHQTAENAADSRERRRQAQGCRARGGRKDANEPGPDAIDRRCTQRLARERAFEKQEEQETEDDGASDNQNALTGNSNRPELEERPRDRLAAEAFRS